MILGCKLYLYLVDLIFQGSYYYRLFHLEQLRLHSLVQILQSHF